MSIYKLKPAFQNALRPLVRVLAACGVTANQVTIGAVVLSVVYGCLFAWGIMNGTRWIFFLLPAILFLRMALNAIDGMLAREYGMKSNRGAFLNELGDVVSDAALYLPFALLPGNAFAVIVTVLLAVISEMTGVVAVMTGASRRYDGPMGKSDRAFTLGAFAIVLGLWVPTEITTALFFMIVAFLLLCTIGNRIHHALKEVS